jgi:hypothetical protein
MVNWMKLRDDDLKELTMPTILLVEDDDQLRACLKAYCQIGLVIEA